MKSKWIKGLEADAARDVKAEFKASVNLRNRMIQLIDVEIENSYKKLENLEVYRIFHRKEYIADLFGNIRAMRDIKELITEKNNGTDS